MLSRGLIGAIELIEEVEIDIDTFFDRIRQNLIDHISRELTDLNSTRVQITAWIRFRKEVEDENGNVIGVDRVRLPFNSRMTDIF